MPKGDGVECILFGLVSLFCFALAGLALWSRPRAVRDGWKALILACTMGLKSAEQYRPCPVGVHSPYTWAFGVLVLVALGRYLQERRHKTEQPVA